MFAEAITIVGLMATPFAGGFTSRFAETRTAQRRVQVVAFVPVLMLLTVVIVTSTAETGSAVWLVPAFASVGVSALFMMLGRAFGRPFAEIREERRRDRTRRVFE
ncbi:MAG: hypothetical protein AAGJ32_09215 [Pseudomonadota bacterium]